MQINRLLSTLMLLQAHSKLTADELADRLEVSPRTILRDMEALSAAGIPVVADRGRGGGWSLIEGYRTSLTGLHSDEIQALVLAAPVQLLQDLGLDDAAEQAALKLLAALPSVRHDDAERMRERIHIDGTRWVGGEDESHACLPMLQDALWKDRRITVEYTRGDGESVSRTLEPLGLVAKGRIWYLIAQVDDDLRTYRVSRIQQVNVLDESFNRPQHFDLADYWEQSTRTFVANLPQFPVTLRLQKDSLWLIQSWRWATIESTSPADGSGWMTVQITCETLEEATACVLACGEKARVISPDELAIEVRRQIEAMSENLQVDNTTNTHDS